MLVVNLFGPPSSGKTTVQCDVFRRLKQAGVNCEMLPEVAKKLTWERRWPTLRCQPYIFGKTLHDMQTLREQVDVLVLDSPLMLCAVYNSLLEEPAGHFTPMVADAHARFTNVNYMLRRTFDYASEGRRQNEEEAERVARTIRTTLDETGIRYLDLDSDDETGWVIADLVLSRLKVG
jgi:nicotinamide riboside kinase